VDEDDGNEECVAFGMEWDETQKDYNLFFCEPGKENGIKDMKSKDLNYAYFTSTDTNEGWASGSCCSVSRPVRARI
jgi:hypothetical protein